MTARPTLKLLVIVFVLGLPVLPRPSISAQESPVSIITTECSYNNGNMDPEKYEESTKECYGIQATVDSIQIRNAALNRGNCHISLVPIAGLDILRQLPGAHIDDLLRNHLPGYIEFPVSLHFGDVLRLYGSENCSLLTASIDTDQGMWEFSGSGIKRLQPTAPITQNKDVDRCKRDEFISSIDGTVILSSTPEQFDFMASSDQGLRKYKLRYTPEIMRCTNAVADKISRLQLPSMDENSEMAHLLSLTAVAADLPDLASPIEYLIEGGAIKVAPDAQVSPKIPDLSNASWKEKLRLIAHFSSGVIAIVHLLAKARKVNVNGKNIVCFMGDLTDAKFVDLIRFAR